jgi:protein-disulfide isomerase
MKFKFCIVLLLTLTSINVWAETPIAESQKYLEVLPNDFVLGNRNAKVTFIEYSSLSCPMCAYFHNNLFLDIKKDYIDTGLIKYIHRNYPLDEKAVKAAILTFCTADKHYLFLQALFETQQSWVTSNDYIPILENIAQLGGLTKEQFDKCLNNKDIENQILQSRVDAHNILHINATPTFIINGEKLPGVPSKKQLFKIIDQKLRDEHIQK